MIESMKERRNPVAQRLFEAFLQFKKLNWRQSPAPGLTPGEVMVLVCIKRRVLPGESGIRVSTIGSVLRVASPTITQQVNSLEENGYVERSVDSEDRRAVRVRLTPKGELAVNTALEKIFENFDGLVEYLGEEDSKQLSTLLLRVFSYYSSKAAEESTIPAVEDVKACSNC